MYGYGATKKKKRGDHHPVAWICVRWPFEKGQRRRLDFNYNSVGKSSTVNPASRMIAFGNLPMVGDNDLAIGFSIESQHDVATALAIVLIAYLAQCADNVATGENPERTQIFISTISSVIAGGIGSPWASRLSI